MSQIDIAPTLLGLLSMSYASKFYGYDLFNVPASADRAFVGNYQLLGYMKAERIVALAPQRKVSVASLPPDVPRQPGADGVSDDELRKEAISYYESASYVYKRGLYRDEAKNKGS
jgi:phosphoglycerol transferase MdoB-like AlkP superfamily enzyme